MAFTIHPAWMPHAKFEANQGGIKEKPHSEVNPWRGLPVVVLGKCDQTEQFLLSLNKVILDYLGKT